MHSDTFWRGGWSRLTPSAWILLFVSVHSVQGVPCKKTCKCWSFRTRSWVQERDFRKKRMQKISIVYSLTSTAPVTGWKESFFSSVFVSESGQLLGELLQWVGSVSGLEYLCVWRWGGHLLTLRENGQALSCSCEDRLLWFHWLASALSVWPRPSECWAPWRTASSWHTFSPQQLVFHRGSW